MKAAALVMIFRCCISIIYNSVTLKIIINFATFLYMNMKLHIKILNESQHVLK